MKMTSWGVMVDRTLPAWRPRGGRASVAAWLAGLVVVVATGCGDDISAQSVREDYAPQVDELRQVLQEVAAALPERRSGSQPPCPGPADGSAPARFDAGDAQATNTMFVMEASLPEPRPGATDEDAFDLEVDDPIVYELGHFADLEQASDDDLDAMEDWEVESIAETLEAAKDLKWVVVVRVVDYVPPVISSRPGTIGPWWEGSVALELAVVDLDSASVRCVFGAAAESPGVVTDVRGEGAQVALYEDLAYRARVATQRALARNDQCCGTIDLGEASSRE
jgi:hypothetical protein